MIIRDYDDDDVLLYSVSGVVAEDVYRPIADQHIRSHIITNPYNSFGHFGN